MVIQLIELRRVLACSTATLALFSSVHAGAQEATEDTDDTRGEIVVTALKRETRLQDTPIAISAVTGENLQNQGISTAMDMVRQVPGLNMTEGQTGQRGS